MARLPHRCPFYFFRSKSTGHRKGWVFPSRKAANKAFHEENWKYLDYPDFDEYIKTVPKNRWKWAVGWWKAAKANVEDLELCRGYLKYVETNAQERDKNLKEWKQKNAHLLEKESDEKED